FLFEDALAVVENLFQPVKHTVGGFTDHAGCNFVIAGNHEIIGFRQTGHETQRIGKAIAGNTDNFLAFALRAERIDQIVNLAVACLVGLDVAKQVRHFVANGFNYDSNAGAEFQRELRDSIKVVVARLLRFAQRRNKPGFDTLVISVRYALRLFQNAAILVHLLALHFFVVHLITSRILQNLTVVFGSSGCITKASTSISQYSANTCASSQSSSSVGSSPTKPTKSNWGWVKLLKPSDCRCFCVAFGVKGTQ